MESTTVGRDKEEFETIYNRYYLPVYRFFFKRLANKEVCEDLTSDVFYSCLKKYDSYDPSKAAVATWIYSVANNKLKNHYRDRKEHTSIDETDSPIDLPDNTDMDGAVFIMQMKEHLASALKSVPELESEIIKLRYFSGLSSDEIAVQVGKSAGNVRVILSRTVKKLADYFEEHGISWE